MIIPLRPQAAGAYCKLGGWLHTHTAYRQPATNQQRRFAAISGSAIATKDEDPPQCPLMTVIYVFDHVAVLFVMCPVLVFPTEHFSSPERAYASRRNALTFPCSMRSAQRRAEPRKSQNQGLPAHSLKPFSLLVFALSSSQRHCPLAGGWALGVDVPFPRR